MSDGFCIVIAPVKWDIGNTGNIGLQVIVVEMEFKFVHNVWQMFPNVEVGCG